jgi:hypothetical protein
MKSTALIIFCLAMTGASFAQLPDCGATAGWKQEDAARAYTPDNLYEYMDGASEGYFIYGFTAMKGITCASGDSKITIDISGMGDSENAYGMLASMLDPRLPLEKIGVAGQISPQRLLFVKGKYYVELTAHPEKDFTPQLKAYASIIEKNIKEQGSIPKTISWFPQEHLSGDTNAVRMVPESVLGLKILKSGYTGQYDFGKAFIVKESSPESAAQIIVKLKEKFGETKPVKIADEAFTSNDKYLKRICIFRKGSVIGGFVNLNPDRDGVAESIKLAEKIN